MESGEEWTYQMFELKRIEVSEVLSELGVKRYDRVFVMMENCMAYGAVVLGVLSLGACAVLINQQSTPRENLEMKILHHSINEIIDYSMSELKYIFKGGALTLILLL